MLQYYKNKNMNAYYMCIQYVLYIYEFVMQPNVLYISFVLGSYWLFRNVEWKHAKLKKTIELALYYITYIVCNIIKMFSHSVCMLNMYLKRIA